MKKNEIAAVLLLSATLGFSQPYGTILYPTGSMLNSGYLTGVIPGNNGFIMAGMNGANPHIDKTQSGGAIPSLTGPNSFQRNYFITENGTCGTVNGTPVSSCIGVSAIELRQPSTGNYAMVGAYSEGCFLTFLNSGGAPVSTVTFEFPSTATFIDKPLIVQESTSLELYICGKYDATMYALKYSASGVLLWSWLYNAGNGPLIEPRDMIISKHTGELVIVGHMTPDFNTYGSASDGFFMALNRTTGSVNNFKNYTSTPCTWFNAVKEANSAAAQGYIIGGYTDPTTINGTALMMKISFAGNIIWNTLIESGTPGIYASEIKGVIERVNTSSQYEYYGIAQTYDNNSIPPLADMTIFKLNFVGNPAPGANEFHYAASAGNELRPVNLSFIPNTATSDVGLHAYVRHTSGHYLQESFFNGVTGCPSPNFVAIANTESGPNMFNMPVNIRGSLTQCNKLSVSSSVSSGAGTIPVQCVGTSATLAGGSNARTVGLTKDPVSFTFNVYPNPGNGMYTLENDAPVHVTIYNMLGEEVISGEYAGGKTTIDLVKEKPGAYLVKVSDVSGTRTLQLIKN